MVKTRISEPIVSLGDLTILHNCGLKLRTAFLLIPAFGCMRNCTHCLVKLLASTEDSRTEAFVRSRIQALDEYLEAHPEFQAIRLFFSGNGFWPEELNPLFWELVPEVLAKHNIQLVGIEVRPDDIVDHENMVQENLVTALSQRLKALNIQMRLIFGIEFVTKSAIKSLGKFPSWYTDHMSESLKELITYLKENDIRYSAYAMFGGQIYGQAMTGAVAVRNVYLTYRILSALGFEEVIINTQYADNSLRGKVYIPTLKDLKALLKDIQPHLVPETRARITLEAEDGAADFIRLTSEQIQWVEDFNLAPNQARFLEEKLNDFGN